MPRLRFAAKTAEQLFADGKLYKIHHPDLEAWNLTFGLWDEIIRWSKQYGANQFFRIHDDIDHTAEEEPRLADAVAMLDVGGVIALYLSAKAVIYDQYDECIYTTDKDLAILARLTFG